MKINLGCGASPTEGYLNIDNSPTVRLARSALAPLFPTKREFIAAVRSKNIRYGSATRIPVADDSAEVLYASHMLEHLDREEAVEFLREAKRALRPGGTLRIVVPDLRLIVDGYIASGDADKFMAGLLTCERKPKGVRQKIRYLLSGWRHHHWMYDANSLKRMVAEAGFGDIRILEPGETTIDDPGALNLREREDESLYLECRR